MPQHTAELCPECGTPLTATNFCTHCEEQREGDSASSNGSATRNDGSPNGRSSPDTDTTARSARVGAIAVGAAATAVALGAALMSRRRRRRVPRGLLARLR